MVSAYCQCIIIGFIFAGIPGAFNSIIGLHTDIPKENLNLGYCILYFLFGFGGFVAPGFANKFGPRVAMFAGGGFYALFSLSLLLAGPYKAVPYVFCTICAALVGVGAAILWTGQAMMVLSYPTEYEKGKYISTFWVLFNLGAVIGGIQSWLTNLNGESKDGGGASMFYLYIAECLVATVAVWTLKPLDQVIRSDGTRCEAPVPSSPMEEIRKFCSVLTDKRVLALIPLFIYSNWFYAFQLTSFSGGTFDTGASGLAGALYWGAQMVGAKVLGCIMDNPNFSTGKRAYLAIGKSVVLISISWVWGIFANRSYHLDDALVPDGQRVLLDWRDDRFVQAALLMTLWGYCDALVQTWCYWVMMQIYTKAEDLGRVAAAFKLFQSVASAVSFFLGYAHLSATDQLWIAIVLFVISVPGAFYLCSQLAKPRDVEKLVAP